MVKLRFFAAVAGVLLPASIALAQSVTAQAPTVAPGAVQATAPAAGAAAEAEAATERPDQWRYVWHNNQWWYYTPQNSWLTWNGNAWNAFNDNATAAGGTRSYRSGAYDNRSYGSRYNSNSGVSGGYLSPNGPSSRANQYRVPFYMRADRRVLGLYP